MPADRLRDEEEYEKLQNEWMESIGLHNEFKSDPKIVKKSLKHSDRLDALWKEHNKLEEYRATNKLEWRAEIEIIKKQISILRQIERSE